MNWNLFARPVALQRLEGAVLLAAAVWLYRVADANWLIFAVLLLAPDVSAISYLRGPAFGATIYNLVHSYALPAALAAYGQLLAHPLATALALIWFAHIGIDRLAGYGLKYPDRFGHTHLAQFGRKTAPEPVSESPVAPWELPPPQ
jgi:hypothetical protein